VFSTENMMNPQSNAVVFADLHKGPSPLRLPNAWDAGSARLIENLGASAIATTSAGVAWSMGYRDRDAMPLGQHLASVAAIARVINVPLSVDIESGYTGETEDVRNTVGRFIDAGAVGINIQDGHSTPDVLAGKIERAREAGERCGVRIYINARTDVYALGLVPTGDRVTEVLARAKRYADAGADGLFVLGVAARADIKQIAAGTDLLLNVIAWPELPPATELAALGVRRVSVGSWIPQSLWAHTSTLVTDFLTDGRSEPLFEGAAPYSQVDALFSN
jgi:2-methylisocitrate lyase-like PEP mutase family enzyme